MDGARTWLANHLPPITASAPDAPCWIILNRSSWYGNFTQEIVDTIISAEKNRLLAFRKSFYMYLTVIAQPSQGIQAGYDPLLDRR